MSKIILTPQQEVKKVQGLCICDGCFKPIIKGRNMCAMHRKRLERERNPLKDIYRNKKKDAKKRGYEFTLTFERLTELANEFDLLSNRGKRKWNLSIDRKNEELGYTNENTTIRPLGENAAKYHKYVRKTISSIAKNIKPIKDCPF